MEGKVFHSVVSDIGHMGVQCNHCDALTIISYRSHHASRKTNEWLERQMIKVYTKYYFKVLLETQGRFWEDKENQAITYVKGGAVHGRKA